MNQQIALALQFVSLEIGDMTPPNPMPLEGREYYGPCELHGESFEDAEPAFHVRDHRILCDFHAYLVDIAQ